MKTAKTRKHKNGQFWHWAVCERYYRINRKHTARSILADRIRKRFSESGDVFMFSSTTMSNWDYIYGL